jgi:hypothetical protein
VTAGRLGIRPGWTRVGFGCYLSEETFEYIVAAVHLVATFGVRLQPLYRFDAGTGLWSHRDQPPAPDCLAAISYRDDVLMTYAAGTATRDANAPLTRYLEDARAIIAAAPPAPPATAAPTGPDEFERLRWFDLPAACRA